MQCNWPPHTTGASPAASTSSRDQRMPKDETFEDSNVPGSSSEVNGGLHLLADAASAVNNNYTVLHLELLHYYLTKTVFTVSRDHDIEVWRDVIPRYAYGRPWLMNGMLAIGALHRAHDDHSMAHICVPLVSLLTRGKQSASCLQILRGRTLIAD